MAGLAAKVYRNSCFRSQHIVLGASRLLPALCRHMCNDDSSVHTASKQGTPDQSPYKLKEYFSYNDYSFYDIESEIDGLRRRQTQPDPRVSYSHTDPWKKESKNTAQSI